MSKTWNAPARGGALSIAVAGALLGLAGPAAAHGPGDGGRHDRATHVYVSPGGDDAAAGTRARPLRTIARARDVVRALPRPLRGDVTVHLSRGTHQLEQPLELDARDSGSPRHPIVYTADRGPAVISGGRQISGWRPAGDGRWTASVGDLQTRQLYVDGRRAVRAQGTPPALRQTAAGYTAADPATVAWRNPADVELVYRIWWAEHRIPVDRVDGAEVTMAQPTWRAAHWHSLLGRIDQPTLVENAYELLDEPGEWYLDRAQQTIHYIPRPGEDMRRATVVAPVLQSLVQGRGTLDAPLHDVTFRGLTFSYATWELGVGETRGLASTQANVMMSGTEPSPTSSFRIYNEFTPMPANVSFTASEDIRVERSTFTHLGAAGLAFNGGSRDAVVERSEFADISGSAIQLGGISVEDHHPSDPRSLNSGFQIRDNRIHDVAAEYRGGVGIFAGYVSGTTIEHNELSNLPYTGITLGWGWGLFDAGGNPDYGYSEYTTPTTLRRNAIRNNLIHDYQQVLDDGGGIYTLSAQGTSYDDGLAIEGNVIYDRGQHFGSTIYTDAASRWVTIRDNAMWNNPGLKDHTDFGGCGPSGDMLFAGNYWEIANSESGQGERVGFHCGAPPHPVSFADNTVIAGSHDVPQRILREAGVRRGR